MNHLIDKFINKIIAFRFDREIKNHFSICKTSKMSTRAIQCEASTRSIQNEAPDSKRQRPSLYLTELDWENLNPNQRNLDGTIIHTTFSGGIMALSDGTIAKWYKRSIPIKQVVKAHRGCYSQKGKKGCIQVSALQRGRFNGESVMYYTMPAAKIDLLDWIDDRCNLSNAKWSSILSTSGLQIIKTIAQLLHGVHTTGNKVIHCDVKPDNICLFDVAANLYNIVLIDFDDCVAHNGSAKKLDRTVGTDGYMAPEMRRNNICGTFTDAWSLGIVLLMLINRSAHCLQDHKCLYEDILCAKKFLSNYPLEGNTSEVVEVIIDGLLNDHYHARMTLPEVIDLLKI